MATRMQQRRGTAAQWISTNSGNGPILNAGEIGWESDTNKFKIGDGTNTWLALDYFADVDSTVNPAFGSSITFEGATANAFETTLAVTDPTADRTITLPDATGTVITTGNLSDITNIGVFTSTIVMEGSTADSAELTLSAGDPTVDRTITFPDATGTVALIEDLNSSLGSYVETADIGATSGVAGLDGSKNLLVPGTKIIFEGTENTFETEFVVTDPTADVTITFPDATGTVALAGNVAALSGATFTGAVSGTDLTLSGNLTVNGTTTNINSTNLVVEDKNVVLGDTGTPTDITADGGGITLKGSTDKTFNWVDSTDAWTSSEHINLASGKTLKYNGTDLVAAQSGNSGKFLTTDGTSTSWATVSGYSAPTLGSTSIASGATVTTIEGLTDIVLNGPGSVKDELTLLLMGAL
jgi:formylmethanofuran dehydrogenase subunit C